LTSIAKWAIAHLFANEEIVPVETTVSKKTYCRICTNQCGMVVDIEARATGSRRSAPTASIR
jgi:hypothetical protein